MRELFYNNSYVEFNGHFRKKFRDKAAKLIHHSKLTTWWDSRLPQKVNEFHSFLLGFIWESYSQQILRLS